MAFAQSVRTGRPIPGAVATLGVSDRVTFLRKTYALLGVALLALAAFTGGMIVWAPETSFHYSAWAYHGWNIWIVMMAFMVVGTVAQRLAMSPVSRARQLVGLGLSVVIWSFLLQPLVWACIAAFGATDTVRIVSESVVITMVIFLGLTLTVFITRKDFTFLRGGLTIAFFALFGIALASWIFGFQLGMLFVGLLIVLMGGYILYQTSLILSQFPPTAHVAAALMLFSSVATMFYYVLIVMMNVNGGRRR